MTKSSLRFLALGASLIASAAIAAESASKTVAVPPASAAAAPKPQKLIRVSTLNTVQANQEFQQNVQIMQAQRQQVIEASNAFEAEKDPAKKKELKAKADALLAKLNDDNQKMFKTYGFTLDRNYTMVIETAHVYMLVSDEEAAKFEKEQAAAAAKEQAEKAKAAPKKK
jgi:hypothetical protein